MGLGLERDEAVVARAPVDAAPPGSPENDRTGVLVEAERRSREPAGQHARRRRRRYGEPGRSRVRTEYASMTTCAGRTSTASSASAAASCCACHAQSAATTALVSAVSAGPVPTGVERHLRRGAVRPARRSARRADPPPREPRRHRNLEMPVDGRSSSSAPGVNPSSSRSGFGTTSRPAASMVVRMARAYRSAWFLPRRRCRRYAVEAPSEGEYSETPLTRPCRT